MASPADNTTKSASASTAQLEHDASVEIERILGGGLTKPKHIVEGITSGVGIIIRGAIGACGTAILMPVAGAAHGQQEMGVPGAVLGTIGGLFGGIVHAANHVTGSLVAGTSQIIKGTVATPAAIVNPINNNKNNNAQGKRRSSTGGHIWWNANEGKWVTTNLLDEERWIQTQAAFDEDILGDDVIPENLRTISSDDGDGTGAKKKKVKDTYYYDLLNVDPSVDSDMIKRRYYIVARKFSPDRCGSNPKAQKQFQEIGHAYMVLMNEELREKYDRVGRAGLWKEDIVNKDDEDYVDPNMLYTFLFGSEKFNEDYIGRLAAGTAARVGENPTQTNQISIEDSRLLQRRRVTRLALKLADRLTKFAEDDMENSAKAEWKAEAEILADTSYGVELLHVIGKIYTLSAVQFLGAYESGFGMPSISNWARSQVEQMKMHGKRISDAVHEIATAGTDNDQHHFHTQVSKGVDKSNDDPDLEVMAIDILKKSNLQAVAIQIMWSQTVVDISNTLHEVIQYVLHDSNVSGEVRKKRGEGLLILGETFQNQEYPTVATTTVIDQQEELEEIAFHAMLDTVWRQETEKRQQQVVYQQ